MSRLPYTPPTIELFHVGQGHPFRPGTSPSCPDIAGVPVPQLVEEFGSPLFVFSEQSLRDKCREANRAFSRRYPKVQFAWSYKTNYLNAICNVFHQEGSIAEVVSGFEYEKARQNGIPGNRIIFNGPHKSRAELERAATENALIQVDNLDELLTLADIGKGRTTPIGIALRIHLQTGSHEVWSKFGFSGDNGEAEQIMRRLQGLPQLRLQGLHCHVGTFILDPDAYRTATLRLVALAKQAEELALGPISYLNLGGGFASKSRLHYQYLPPEQATPSMDRYAEAICDTLTLAWPRDRDLPTLYLETGRAMVDESGYLVSTVVAVKSRPQERPNTRTAMAAFGKNPPSTTSASSSKPRTGLVIDSGVHLLYTSTWHSINVLPVRACTDAPQPTTVYGCLCMNIDVIREQAPLPALTTGDQVVMHPVGAYNVTQSMQFITYRPAVVMIDLEGKARVIRRRENLAYVQELEEVPEHLCSSRDVTTPATAHSR